MSPDTVNVIILKLQKLDTYLTYLQWAIDQGEERFISDFQVHGVGERYLQLAIEVVLDAGKMLIVERKLKRPENAHDIFALLHSDSVIDRELFERCRTMAGLRNILVHEYSKIDHKRLFELLKTQLGDFALLRSSFIGGLT